jgi:hypothetical protein
MKNFLLLIFLVLFSTTVYAQKRAYYTPSNEKKNTDYLSILKFGDKYCISFSYSSISASAYYDYNGKMITRLSDSSLFVKDSIINEYNFDIVQTEIAFTLEKYFNDNSKLKIELPFSYYSLNETYNSYQDKAGGLIFTNIKRAEYSLFRLDHILAGGEYGERNDYLKATAKLYFKIPTGFEEGVYSNNKDFLSDGDFEILSGFDLYVYPKKMMFKIGTTYNFRTEDLQDRIISTFEGNIFSVPGTMLGAKLTWVQNIKKLDIAKVFNINKFPYSENYFEAGINFGIDLGEDFVSFFKYNIRLFGNNSWNFANYNFIISYNF